MWPTAVACGERRSDIAGARSSIESSRPLWWWCCWQCSQYLSCDIAQINPQLLAPSITRRQVVDVISSVALTFFAYLGFAVISFTGGDLPDPARNRREPCTSHSALPQPYMC